MKKSLLLAVLLLSIPFLLQGKEKLSELKAVEEFDVNRCLGTWFEIARMRYFFERNVVCGASTLSILPNGDFRIFNQGHKGTFDGKRVSAKGIAWRADKKSKSKFKVRFFWPFYGQYWVLEVGKDYEYVVVGHPKRKHLWILSRTPHMDKAAYSETLKRLDSEGFDLSRLEEIPQNTADSKQ